MALNAQITRLDACLLAALAKVRSKAAIVAHQQRSLARGRQYRPFSSARILKGESRWGVRQVQKLPFKLHKGVDMSELRSHPVQPGKAVGPAPGEQE